ncbi:hypothetical protein ACHAXS_011653 [Conticribra weissflogii]
MDNYHTYRVTEVDVGTPPLASRGWEVFNLNFHDFEKLPSKKGNSVESPKFTYDGHEWSVKIYPGGTALSDIGHVSAYLKKHTAKGGKGGNTISIDFAILITDLDDITLVELKTYHNFGDGGSDGGGISNSQGWKNVIKRADILSQNKHILRDGTFSITLLMKTKHTAMRLMKPFVPKNLFSGYMSEMLNTPMHSDVFFRIERADGNGVNDGLCECKQGSDAVPALQGNMRGESTDEDEVSLDSYDFFAHRLVLKACAPVCEPYPDMTTIPIHGVDFDGFELALGYVYGFPIPYSQWKKHSKGVMEVADRFGIVSLKLEAETWFVKFTKITTKNAFDLLLYADAKNLHLLREAVMAFFVKNAQEALRVMSFDNVPYSKSLLSDLLAIIAQEAVSEEKKENAHNDSLKYKTMDISSLRMEASEQHKEIDGSREALIRNLATEK